MNYARLLTKIMTDIEENSRQTGRTTTLVRKALKEDALFVCHNSSMARILMKETPGLRAVSMEVYLRGDILRGKRNQKVVFDHFVEYEMIKQKLAELDKLFNYATKTNDPFETARIWMKNAEQGIQA